LESIVSVTTQIEVHTAIHDVGAMMTVVASNRSNSNNTTVMLSAQEQITMMMNDDLLVTEPPANRDDGTLPVFKISYIIGSGTILKVHIVCRFRISFTQLQFLFCSM
jgi:hypothetical protein